MERLLKKTTSEKKIEGGNSRIKDRASFRHAGDP